MTFGERLLYFIERENLSQKDLADRIGITPTRLNYWVKDKREPDVFHIKALARALNVTGDELLGTDTSNSSLSEAATRIGAVYDKLTPTGKELVDSVVAFAEKHHTAHKPSVPDDLPMQRIGTVNGVPLFQLPDDMRLPTKEAAREEQKEMIIEAEATIPAE